METKSIWKSKTFWANIIPLVLAVIALIDPNLLTVFGIEGLSQTKALVIIAFITSFLNIILRSITNTAVSFSAPSKLPLIIGLIFMAGYLFADSVKAVPFDSTKLHNEIVNTTNAIIATIPAPNPLIEGLKIFFIAIGSGVTGWCIHFFKKKNAVK